MFSCLSSLGKSVLIVALAAGLLTQFFPCCTFAIRSFSKVSVTPDFSDEANSAELPSTFQVACSTNFCQLPSLYKHE